jgi:hypothetical protein
MQKKAIRPDQVCRMPEQLRERGYAGHYKENVSLKLTVNAGFE